MKSRLKNMEPDVEALLVNRIGHARAWTSEYFLVPIDQCYKLVGLIRSHGAASPAERKSGRRLGFFDA